MFLPEVIDLLSQARKAAVGVSDTAVAFRVRKVKPLGIAKFATVPEWDRVVGYAQGLLDDLRAAHPFEFRNVPFDGTSSDHYFVIPSIREEGRRVFNRASSRLPFGSCWFEIDTSAGVRLGLLVRAEECGIGVTEFWRYDESNGHQIQFCCHEVSFLRHDLAAGSPDFAPGVPGEADKLLYVVRDPFGHFERYKAWQASDPRRQFDATSLMETMTRESMLGVYFSLVLLSNRKTVTAVAPSALSNRIRSDRGLSRIPEYHLVDLPADWHPGDLPKAEKPGEA